MLIPSFPSRLFPESTLPSLTRLPTQLLDIPASAPPPFHQRSLAGYDRRAFKNTRKGCVMLGRWGVDFSMTGEMRSVMASSFPPTSSLRARVFCVLVYCVMGPSWQRTYLVTESYVAQ